VPIQTAIRWSRDFVKYRVLHVDDTPHRIALGMAIAMLVTWTPAIGLQMIGTVLLCSLFGANKVVGLPLVWISNPVTIVPIYLPNYLLGRWILGSESKDINWRSAFTAVRGNWLEQLVARIQNWWELTIDVFWPLWLGSLLIGLALGAGCYVGVYYLVLLYRKRRPHLRLRLHRRHRPHDDNGPAAPGPSGDAGDPGQAQA